MYYCKNCGCRSQVECSECRGAPMQSAFNNESGIEAGYDTRAVRELKNQKNHWEANYETATKGEERAQINTHHANCALPYPPCNEQLPLAFAVTPFQKLEEIYDGAQAIRAGTIFPSLDMPYAKRSFFGGMRHE